MYFFIFIFILCLTQGLSKINFAHTSPHPLLDDDYLYCNYLEEYEKQTEYGRGDKGQRERAHVEKEYILSPQTLPVSSRCLGQQYLHFIHFVNFRFLQLQWQLLLEIKRYSFLPSLHPFFFLSSLCSSSFPFWLENCKYTKQFKLNNYMHGRKTYLVHTQSTGTSRINLESQQ